MEAVRAGQLDLELSTGWTGAGTGLAVRVRIRHLHEAAGLVCGMASVSHVREESRKEGGERGLVPRQMTSRWIRRWSPRNQFNTDRDCQSQRSQQDQAGKLPGSQQQ